MAETKILHGDEMFKEIAEWVTKSTDEWNEHTSISRVAPETTERAVTENSTMDRHIFGRWRE
jgi:hypothetical protein